MADDPKSADAANAAVRTLTYWGYTWCGGELWKPPVGPIPAFNSTPKVPVRCWPWLHDWSKWEVYKQPYFLPETNTQGTIEKQKRCCAACGLEQRRDFE